MLDSVIVLIRNLENIADEAKSVGQLIGKGRHMILVTSANYMFRSLKILETQDFIRQPFKLDHKLDQLNSITVKDFVPDIESVALLNLGYREVYREVIGQIIYTVI